MPNLVDSPSDQTAADLIQAADAAYAAGALSDSIRLLMQALKADPGRHDMQLVLAQLLEKEGRLDEAEAELSKLLAIQPSAQAFAILARVQVSLHKYAEAERSFERLSELAPSLPSVDVKLAKLRMMRSDFSGAEELLAKALQKAPGDLDVILAYANAVAATDEARALAFLEGHKATFSGDPPRRSQLLRRILELGEVVARRAAGLPPDSAVSWRDACEFKVRANVAALQASLEEEITAPTARADAFIDLGSIALANSDWVAAERYFTPLRAKTFGKVVDNIVLDRAFFEKLENTPDEAFLSGLPDVKTLQEADTRDRPILYLASDTKYFEKFTLKLLKSLSAVSSNTCAHIHFMDGDESVWPGLLQEANAIPGLRISATGENSRAFFKDMEIGPDYFHSVRYIRFHQQLMKQRQPMWIVDVDGIVNRDPYETLLRLQHYEIALKADPTTFEPWNKVHCGIIGINPTSPAILFSRIAASFIHENLKIRQLRWSIDQVAFFLAYLFIHEFSVAPRTWFLDSELTSLEQDKGSIFDLISGSRKHILFL